MRIVDCYPLITTPELRACRDFYVRHFGFEVGFEASWFLYLTRPAAEGESPASLVSRHASDVEGWVQPSSRSARRRPQPRLDVWARSATPRCDSRASSDRHLMRDVTLAFMAPDHPSHPPGPEPFNGLGAILTFQVEDARAAYAELQASGAPIFHPLTREPWGQLRFACRDPAGVMIDICEQVAPEEGYWDANLQ